MYDYHTSDLGGFVCYVAGGTYYLVRTRVLGGPSDMGRQALSEIPVDSEEFNGNLPADAPMDFVGILTSYAEWKSKKIQHFQTEDMRLHAISASQPNDNLDNPFHGYLARPTRHFPTDYAAYVQWIYVVDLDNETFSVGIPFHIRRVFHLRQVPRALFAPKPTGTGEIPEFDHYRVLIDPVPRNTLAGISVPREPDLGLIELYHSCAPQVNPLPLVDASAALSVRKHLRLCLGSIYIKGHTTALHEIYTNNATLGDQPQPPGWLHGPLGFRFRQLVYGIVSLYSSTLQVHFRVDRRYNSSAQWHRYHRRDQWDPLTWMPPLDEYWIGDILIVPEVAISTTECLQAAIGKAVQVINARNATTGEASPVTTRAVIISLNSLVVVDVCGNTLTHTPNMTLLARYHSITDGMRTLLDVLFTPAPHPAPQSFPRLPVEMCRKVFRYATEDTRHSLALTCRLFHGIAYDYGPRISEWNLQAVPRPEAYWAFTAVADRGVHILGGKVRHVPARREQVVVSARMGLFRPIYRVVLRKPDGETIELQLPLVGVDINRY